MKIHTIRLHCLSRHLFGLSRRFLSCIRSIFLNHLQTRLVYATSRFVTFVLTACARNFIPRNRHLELVREAGVHRGCLQSQAESSQHTPRCSTLNNPLTSHFSQIGGVAVIPAAGGGLPLCRISLPPICLCVGACSCF